MDSYSTGFNQKTMVHAKSYVCFFIQYPSSNCNGPQKPKQLTLESSQGHQNQYIGAYIYIYV